MAKKISRIDIIDNDIFKDLKDSSKRAQDQSEALKVSLLAINEVSKEIKKNASALKDSIKIVDASEVANAKKLTEIQKEANKLAVDAEKVNRAKIQTEKEIERLKTIQIRNEKALAKETEKKITLYQQESKRLNEMRKEYKDLALQEQQNTATARALLKEITALDGKLKQVDATVGQHQRNVGNYDGAISKLKGGLSGVTNMLSQFGLAFGGVALAGKGIKTIADFETSVADLSAVTGQSGKDLDFLANKSIEFSKRFGGSASSIVEAFKLAGSARPELLKNGQALSDLTEKAILLSKASGDDVPTSIKNLTGTLNAFELPASQATKVMDILANASQLGAQEIPYLTEAFTKFGGIAKSQGVSIAESAGAIELLGLKMPDAATAGTALRNVMIKLMAPDALGKDAQDRLKNLGINTAELSDKNKSLAERLTVLKPLLNDAGALVKVFGSENALGAQILISQTEQLKTFTEGLDKNGTTQEQANIKSKTLTEAWGRLKAQGEALFLSIRSGANGLSATLDFLSNNFDGIVTAVEKLVEVFISYKLVQSTLKLKESYNDWQANKQAIKETGNALKEGADGAKGFGNALKGIGFSIAITVLFEVGKALYDIASGAKQAREDLALLEKQVNISTKRAEKNVGTIQKDLDTKLKEYEKELKKKGITGIEFQKLSADYAKQQTQNAKNEADKFAKISYQKVLNYREELKILNDLKRSEYQYGFLNEKQKKELLRIEEKYGKELTTEKTLANAISLTKASLAGATEGFQLYRTQVGELSDELLDAEIAVSENSGATSKNTEETKKNKKATKDLKEEKISLTQKHREGAKAIEQETRANLFNADSLKAVLLLEKQRAVTVADIAVTEAEIALEKAKKKGDPKKILEAERKLTDERIKQIQAQLELDLRAEDNLVNQEKLKKDADLKILQLTNDFNDKADQLEKDRLKKRYENVKKYTELANDLAQSQLDKKIELIDKEIDASKKKEQDLEDLAKNGNIKASESIAEQERIQNEQLAQKQKAERQKQLIQSTTAFLTAYANELENGKSSGEALTIALTDKALLDGIISALPTFFVGTEDTGNGGNLDNNGGFLSVLHPNERVMTKEQNQQLNGISNDEVVKMVQKAKINNVQNGSFENVGVLSELNGLKSELGAIKQAILNRPETNIELGAITQGAMEIVHSTKKGNKTTVNTFKVRN
jgi:TP901 family phage tail tape measure protein